MRTPFIAGNWKMNMTCAQAAAFADEFLKIRAGRAPACRTAILAPYTTIGALTGPFGGTFVEIGAQNVHWEDHGAYTGEISLSMLVEIGIQDCIVGHSERRQYFGETDDAVNRKIKKLLRGSGITPILCVGENLEQREAGCQEEIVARELASDLSDLSEEEASKVVIAYEPIWAIGTGKSAGADAAEEMCSFIREKVSGMFGKAAAEKVIIQYGGSVNPSNAEEILGQPDVDGALVGGASLDAEKFSSILDFACGTC